MTFSFNEIDPIQQRASTGSEKDLNMPGARRFYTYAFFGHRMAFLEGHNKPESLMIKNEKAEPKSQ